MDRIAKFLILLVAALVLVPGCFAEELKNETANTTEIAEVVEVAENATETAVVKEVAEVTNGTVAEAIADAVIPDFVANMTVSKLEKVGVNQTVAISLIAEDEGIWNITKTEGLEQVGEPAITNGTSVYTIKALTAGDQSFEAVHKAVNATATEAGETYKLDIIIE